MAAAKKNDAPKFKALGLWARLETTDPKFVKPITGKAYKGNSPHPTWLVRQLTAQLGPCGHGFGWSVTHECYVDGQPHRVMTGPETVMVVFEKMHELRIQFWTRDPDSGEIGHFESYGSTRALYLSKLGKWIHDEDAAKKSLTDAITKAMSQIGGAADIFMGRWDDNKYVASLDEHFANGPDSALTPGVPQGRGAQQALEGTPAPSNGNGSNISTGESRVDPVDGPGF